MAIHVRKRDLENNTYPILASGGESQIYRYQNGKLIKIFKDHVLLSLKERKVKAWLKESKIPFVMAPLDSVEVSNSFKGYLLEEVENASPIGVLAKIKYIKVNHLSNKDILEILISYSKKLEELHRSGKWIGDINENNVLIKGKDLYYIDTDSYGLANLPADAYTEIYTDPKAYCWNGKKLEKIVLSPQTDMFAFALLSFKLLTRMHPFNGAYPKDPAMNTEVRMQKKISVLGNHNVTIPPMIMSWNWMSPSLLKTFLEIFEGNKRCYITKELEELYTHLSYCKHHQIYYYNQYDECPICNQKAKIKITPVVSRSSSSSHIPIKMTYSSQDVELFFHFRMYLSTQGDFVHTTCKNRWKARNGCKIEFSTDGEYVFEIYDSKILVYQAREKKLLFPILKMYHSPVYITGDYIYYINDRMYFCKSQISMVGSFDEELFPVYPNTIFSASKEAYFVALLYPEKILINTNHASIFLNCKDKISEYAILYDEASQNWLFIYEMRNGLHRSIVISKQGQVLYDSSFYRYSVSSLDHICFANNTIFVPSSGKIIGINYMENRVKEFPCHVVTEESILQFRQGGFDIATENKLYRYGV